ncbi:hypothetical protein MMC27_008439 [Xylographa pallens]|nr:hypothetical protein [Xylographa pallens]
MLGIEATVHESIRRWLVEPIHDQPWSTHRTTVTVKQLASWISIFATTIDSSSEKFSPVASSGRSSDYVFSILGVDHDDTVLEEYHDEVVRSPERFRHIEQALENWRSVKWPATYDQHWVFPNGYYTADATARRLLTYARTRAAHKIGSQQDIIIYPDNGSTRTLSQALNDLEAEDEASMHTKATSFMSSIGAGAVSRYPKRAMSRSSYCLFVAEKVKHEDISCVERRCGKSNTSHGSVAFQASDNEGQTEDYEQRNQYSKDGADENTYQIHDFAQLSSKDASEICARTQPRPEAGTSVHQKEKGELQEVQINLAEDSQPSPSDCLDSQPGLELVNDRLRTKLAGSGRSAGWHPKLPGSPVQDCLVQVQKPDAIHTVSVSNQDDGLIPVILENTVLPQVKSEAGTSLKHAKKTIRIYRVKRSMMSIILSIAVSIFVLLALLALLFRLLPNLSATKKPGIGILILQSLVVVATRLYSYYVGKEFEYPKEIHSICQLGMTYLAL